MTPPLDFAPQPVPLEPEHSFTSWAVQNPSAPPPGNWLDGELSRTRGTLKAVLDWVSVSLNSDGSLKSDAVRRAVQNMALPGAQTIDNSDSDNQFASNVAQDYAVLSAAWAEHMPDTIPPNILAANDITGDHWSARWWANLAARLVQDMDVGVGGVPEAPLDNRLYGRQNASWVAHSPIMTNVRDYGARGDSVTDDSAAFVAAFNALPAATGGTIFVPRGNYVLNSPLTFSLKQVALVGEEGATLWLNHDGIGFTITTGDPEKHCSVRDLVIRATSTALPSWAIYVAAAPTPTSANQSVRISGVRILSIGSAVPPPYRGSIMGGIWLAYCWAAVVEDCNYFGPPIGGAGSNPPGSVGLRHEHCYNLVLDGFRTVAADKCVQANDYSEKVVLTRCALLGNWGYYTEPYATQINGFAGLEFHAMWTEFDNFNGNLLVRGIAKGRIVGNNCAGRSGSGYNHIELRDCAGLIVANNNLQQNTAPPNTAIGIHCAGNSYGNVITNNFLSGQIYIPVQFDASTQLNHAHGNLGLDPPNLYVQHYVDLGPHINDTDNTLDWLCGPGRYAAGSIGRTFCNSGGLPQVYIPDVLNPVNKLSLFAGSAGEDPRIIVQGSDVNRGLLVVTKGQGGFVVGCDAGPCLLVAPETATVVNYPVLRSDAAGKAARYEVDGTDTDIDLLLLPKNAGRVTVAGNGVAYPHISSLGSGQNHSFAFDYSGSPATGLAVWIDGTFVGHLPLTYPR
jgi:hypothetical protein